VKDFVHVFPTVVLCGDVDIGEGAQTGAGTVITPGKKIGKWCITGAGSVVIKDIPDYTTAAGNPTKIIKTGLSAL
jgi:acetyltransferase-like isoleucine patch superfamily enzyme